MHTPVHAASTGTPKSLKAPETRWNPKSRPWVRARMRPAAVPPQNVQA